MKLHRFILPGLAWPVGDSEFGISDRRFFHQIKHVLKMRVGEKIIICDGDNLEAQAEIKKFFANSALLQIGKIETCARQPKRNVVLYCAILKKENFETVVQKAVELGVSEVAPIVSSRTIKQKINLDRLKIIALEAAEQCGRGSLPIVREPVSFIESAGDMKGTQVGLFCLPDYGMTIEQAIVEKPGNIAVFIGPEGGWTADETELAKQKNLKPVSLSEFILRGETAAIAAVYSCLK